MEFSVNSLTSHAGPNGLDPWFHHKDVSLKSTVRAMKCHSKMSLEIFLNLVFKILINMQQSSLLNLSVKNSTSSERALYLENVIGNIS